MNSNGITKIKMIKGSMRCFVFGLLGLAPVLGLPLVIFLLWLSSSQEIQFQILAVCLLVVLATVSLAFALPTLWISGRIRISEKTFWNAAKPYRIWGVVYASLVTIGWSGIIILAIGKIVLAIN